MCQLVNPLRTEGGRGFPMDTFTLDIYHTHILFPFAECAPCGFYGWQFLLNSGRAATCSGTFHDKVS